MSALVLLAIDTNMSLEAISAYIDHEFPKQKLTINQYVASSVSDSYEEFWGIRPTVEVALARGCNSNTPNSYLVGFAMLDWIKGDMLLKYDASGVFVRRNGRLIVCPAKLSCENNRHLLTGREFEFSNVGPLFDDLKMQDET